MEAVYKMTLRFYRFMVIETEEILHKPETNELN